MRDGRVRRGALASGFVGLLVVLILAVAVAGRDARAQDVEALMQSGATAFDAGDYAAAARDFAAAREAAPEDLRPAYFEGMARNRLGQYDQALILFALADVQGVTRDRLDFEVGWAAVGVGAWGLAVRRLSLYEADHPEDAKTAEFLGRAYLGAGELGLAAFYLDRAIMLDPGLAESVAFHQARLAAARGDREDADRRLRAYMAEHPDAPIAKALRQIAEARPIKPWGVYAVLGGGFNDNVIGLSDDLATPADISDEADGFFATELGASYTFMLDDSTPLTFGYGGVANVYFDLDDFNLAQHFIYANLARRISDHLGAAVRVYGDTVAIGGDGFRDQFGVRPSVAYRWSDGTILEASYLYTTSDFKFDPLIRAQDRDGEFQYFGVSQYFGIPDTKLRLQASAGLVFNDADGGDFDYEGGLFGATAAYPFDVPVGDRTWPVLGSLGVSYELDDYDQRNSLSGAAGFAFRRDDEILRLTVNALVPVRPGIDVFVLYGYTDANSNIIFFDYDQHVGRGGLTVRF